MDNNQRRDAILAALKMYKDTNDTRTYNIELRNVNRNLEVIQLPPNVPLLNHDNNRLAAQLLDHPKASLVHQNPLSPEAQDVIAELLSATSDFAQLKAELKQVGQKFPGLITRDGLLINGNTRAVALRELNQNGMLLAVLPDGILPEDIIALEVDLQMVQLTHQDYTFTNQLLLLERLSKQFIDATELAKRMNWLRNGTKKVLAYKRILKIIQEIRALETSKPFPFAFFDSKQEHFKNLDEEYEKLKQTSVDSAERMKWSRIAAILLGVPKDQVREIDEDFIAEVIDERVKDDDVKELLKATKSNDDGLGDLLGEASSFDMKEVSKLVLQHIVGVEISLEGKTVKDETLTKVEGHIRVAAQEKINEQILRSYLTEPVDILADASIKLEKMLEKFTQIKATAGFDMEKFTLELENVEKLISQLTKKAKP